MALERRQLIEPHDIFCCGPTHRAGLVGMSGTGLLRADWGGLRVPGTRLRSPRTTPGDPRQPNVKHELGVGPRTPAGQFVPACVGSANTY